MGRQGRQTHIADGATSTLIRRKWRRLMVNPRKPSAALSMQRSLRNNRPFGTSAAAIA